MFETVASRICRKLLILLIFIENMSVSNAALLLKNMGGAVGAVVGAVGIEPTTPPV
jgi:hypothetical protein